MNRYFSLALLVPSLVLSIAAWLIWRWRDSSSIVQNSKWRSVVTILGLFFLSADVVLSGGYLLYESSASIVKFSVFDACSSIGAIFCLAGIVAAVLGKGLAVRLPNLLGCFFGMMFWYLTIGPSS
jgi:hypothetical protein